MNGIADILERAWRCGHPRTDENTKVVRAGTGAACKQCFRQMNRDYMRRKRAASRAKLPGDQS